MTRLHKVISIAALLCLVALTSNGLMSLHLLTCHGDCHSEHGSQSPKHDSDQCPVCQVLHFSTGKFIILTPPATAEQIISCESIVIPQDYSLPYTAIPSITRRGPPA